MSFLRSGSDGAGEGGGGTPPFSLLMPLAPPADGSGSRTPAQWLWHFYLTAWSRPFFSNSSAGSSNLSLEESLSLAGFPAADAIAAYEAQWRLGCPKREDVTAQAASLAGMECGCAYPSLPHVAESHFGRAYRALAVHDHLSTTTTTAATVPIPLSKSSSKSVVNLVQRALHVVVAQQQQRGNSRCVNDGKVVSEEKGDKIIQKALQMMLSPDTTTTQYSLLFTLEETTTCSDSSNRDGGGGHDKNNNGNMREEDLLKEANRASLFAALTLETFGRVKKACASFLLAFVNSCKGKVAKARACGVVVGILEYSMAYRYYREDGTGRCPLNAAALLLCNLVELQDVILRGKMEKLGRAILGNEGEDVSGGFIATTVVACLQGLFFSAVVGGAVSPHVLPPVSARDAPTAMNKSRGKTKQQQEFSLEMTVRPIVSRALTLHEVDSLVQILMPALLQQVGFEWPWSECLRRARLLDKVQQEGATIKEGVRIHSRALFDELLAAIGRRTYVSRLQYILPQSYESLFVAAFPHKIDEINAPENDKNDNGSGKKNGRGSLFEMPAYYRAAGEPLIEFFKNSGVSGVTARETERILICNTDVQPMIVQLQALQNRVSNTDDSVEENHHIEKSNLLSTARLSVDEKHKLVLRYRSEVLLVSLVVYTQLETVSLVQQLIRQLAPLFEKLLLPLMQERTLSNPFVVKRQGRSASQQHVSLEPTIDMTSEFKVLMDEIHYQFYPLEWIPEVLNAQLNNCTSSESEVSPYAYYSVFAAVAHQFGIALHGNRQNGVKGGDATDYQVRVKAYRFFHVLLLNSLVDAVASSCELEGAMALAATRRVGRTQQNNKDHNLHDDESNKTRLQQCGATSFHAVVNPHDAILAMAQCTLPIELISHPETVAEVTGENHSIRSEARLRRVIEWTQSTKSRWAMQQQQQKVAGSSTTSTATTVPLASLHNSLTFDAVPLAREVIRGVYRRLIEKMHVKYTASKMGQCTSPDPLLQQHLLSVEALLEAIGLLPQHPAEKEAETVLSAAQLLWYSPLFSHELQHNGRFQRERVE